MRYTSAAAVLATLTIGQVAAGSVHHRHVHQRRAPEPSAAPAPVPQDWNAIHYTFSKCQQFGTWGHADGCDDTAPAAPTPAPEPVVYGAVSGDKKGGKVDTGNTDNTSNKKAPTYGDTSNKKAPTYGDTSNEEAPAYTSSKSTGKKGGSDGLSAAIFTKLNAKSVASNGMINSAGGEYSLDLVNNAGEELGFYCWPGSSGWNIAVDSPIFAASIPSGMTHTIYMGASSSKIACAALYSDGHMDSTNGIPVETQIELTMTSSTSDSTFDVSQLETASGHYVKMESSVCTAESNGKCSYQCKGSAPCGYVPGEVYVKDCLGAGTTGNEAATDGGCSVGDGKHITVTYG